MDISLKLVGPTSEQYGEEDEPEAEVSLPATCTLKDSTAVFSVPQCSGNQRLIEVLADTARIALIDGDADPVQYTAHITRTMAVTVLGICYSFGVDIAELDVREMTHLARASSRLVTLAGDQLHVELSTNDLKYREIYDSLGDVPNRHFVAANESGCRAVEFPFAGEHCSILVPVIRKYKFDVAADLLARIKELADAYNKTMALTTAVYAEMDIPGLGGNLLPYQKVVPAYFMLKEHVLLADVQGLGKTVEALAALKAADAFPALIICPAIGRQVWEDHCSNSVPGAPNGWLPDIKASIVTPKDSLLAWALLDVVIISYDALSNPNIQKGIEILKTRGLAAVVADESQYIKEQSSQRTRTMLDISRGVRYRMCLTGTPVMNRPAELLPQLEFLDCLDKMGGRAWFNDHFGRFGLSLPGYLAVDLNKRLRTICMVRRRWEDVAEDTRNLRAGKLPRAYKTVALDPTTLREYKLALNNLYAWVRAEAERAFSENVMFEQMSEDDRGNFVASKVAAAGRAHMLVLLNALRMIVGRGKIVHAANEIQEFLDETPDKKLIVFTEHKEVLNALALQFDGVIISGDTPATARSQAVTAFQTDPSVRLAFVSIAAAGTSITLTASHQSLFTEFDWSAGQLLQAEARNDRLGQSQPVQCTYLIASIGDQDERSSTDIDIDGVLFDLVNRKMDLIANITDGEGGSGQNASVLDDLIGQLAKKAMQAKGF